MIRIFDSFTSKEYDFIVEEKDMVEMMKMIRTSKSIGCRTDMIFVGNSKSDEESNHWFINTNLTTNQWCEFLKQCEERKYQLVIKDDPNRMYFTKVKGS